MTAILTSIYWAVIGTIQGWGASVVVSVSKRISGKHGSQTLALVNKSMLIIFLHLPVILEVNFVIADVLCDTGSSGVQSLECHWADRPNETNLSGPIC